MTKANDDNNISDNYNYTYNGSDNLSNNDNNNDQANANVTLSSTLSFKPTPFTPPFWLANPHLQTILPKLFAPKVPNYRREIYKDSLNESDIAYDFYDAHPIDLDSTTMENTAIDNIATQSPVTNDTTRVETTPLIVLFHGMEGSSDSHYARSLAHYFHAQGWHFVVAHFRSCGGIPASGRVFYNAADTTEIHYILTLLQQRYQHIYAVGVSLGGNAIAKYLGEYGDKALCHAGVAVSAPVNMASAAMSLRRFLGQKIYTPYLLSPIVKKALQNDVTDREIAAIKAAQSISDFDHIFTAPRHGFRSNNDYYHQASALPYLINVTKPLLLISAKDDPFLGFTATKNDVSNMVTILDTEHGGHVGFLRYRSTGDTTSNTTARTKRFDIGWLPETIGSYFKSVGIDQYNRTHLNSL